MVIFEKNHRTVVGLAKRERAHRYFVCTFLSLLLRDKEKENYEKKEKSRKCFRRSYEREIEWLLQAAPALFRSLSLC